MVEIVNIVAGGDLERELNLHTLAEDISSYSVDRKANGLYIKSKESSPLIVVYRTGKYVITGASNLDEVKSASEELTNILFDIGVKDIEKSFDIYNLVCVCDFGKHYDLEMLQVLLGFENTEYEPEQSPFLVYRPDDYNCVITISSTGKSVINGVESSEVAEEVFDNVSSYLEDNYGD